MSLVKINIIKNFIYLVITKGVDFLVPVILLPYLVNALGIEQFGLLSFSLAIGVYFSSLMQYGYNISAVRTIARLRDDNYQLAVAFSELLTSSVLICLFFSLCFMFIFLVEEIYSQFYLYISVLLFVLMQSLFPAWLFQGLEKMHYIALSNSLCKFLYLISILYWVHSSDDTYLVPLLQGISWAIALLIAVIIIFKKKLTYFVLPTWRGIKETYRLGWPAFVTQFAPTLYSNSMTFILGIFHGNVVVGVYSAAIRVIEILNALAFLFVNAALPLLSRNITLHKWLKNIMIVVGVSLGIIVYFTSEWFVPMLFSEHIDKIVMLIKVASPMIPLVFCRLAYGPAYLMLIGEEKIYKRIVFLAASIGFIAAWFIIPNWQVEGAVFIMLSTSLLMTILTLVSVARLSPHIKKG